MEQPAADAHPLLLREGVAMSDWMIDRNHWRNRFMPAAILAMFAIWFVLICLVVYVAWHFVMPAGAHDLAAWSDPARDQWFRSLKVPDSQTSCCDLRDGAQMNPDMVRQDNSGAWWVDLGAGFVPVPPERVVRVPVSIDGLPYIFMMNMPTMDSPDRVRCFVPPVGTY